MMSKVGVCRSDLHPKADRGESTRGKALGVCGFKDLEKAYNKINMKAL